MDPFPFIETILLNLADSAPKGVYADWLSENGLPNRADFVRWLARTGRYPKRVNGNQLVFLAHSEPTWWSADRVHILGPEWNRYVIDRNTARVQVFANWVELEQYCTDIWVKLTNGSWLRKKWQPDTTPVPRYDPKGHEIEKYLRGVR